LARFWNGPKEEYMGTLGNWDMGTLGNWDMGTLGNWDMGTLGNWNMGARAFVPPWGRGKVKKHFCAAGPFLQNSGQGSAKTRGKSMNINVHWNGCSAIFVCKKSETLLLTDSSARKG